MLRCHPDHLQAPDDDALAAAYAWPADVGTRTVIRANMVAALDGGISVDGRSADLGGAGDQRIFSILRDLADVILVGAGTIRAEGYGGIRLDDFRAARRRRWGLGAPPPLAVVTGGGLDRDLGMFTDAQTPPIVITTTTGAARMADHPATVVDVGTDSVDLDSVDRDSVERDRVERDSVERDSVDLSRMVAALSDLGFRRVLCEGGPTLLGRLVAADLLDELCLTTSPLTVGAGPATLLGGVTLPAPVPWQLAALHLDGDHVFGRYIRRAR